MNSVPIVVSDGDTTEEAKGERNAKAEIIAVTAHFLPMPQFFGFLLSSSLSQVTYNLSEYEDIVHSSKTLPNSDLPLLWGLLVVSVVVGHRRSMKIQKNSFCCHS